ncbi:MAG TPA: 5-formyltetrahydrofolate cyclo-ligase [bacterium]|nr:5-formyltetrahydrofolate cyclo-ligase [bacterium]
MESKDSLRLRMKSLRRALRPDEVVGLGRRIEERLFASSLLDELAHVALYASVRNEVPTEAIFNQLNRKKCRTYFPRVTSGTVEFLLVEDWSDMESGSWGIPEPKSGKAEPVGRMDAVVIPGLAFDVSGVRMGFGQGYYDRVLQGYTGRKVGLAYDFQVLDAIPRVVTDLVCDWIVTETRVIGGGAGR